jgi:hypothetical protein
MQEVPMKNTISGLTVVCFLSLCPAACGAAPRIEEKTEYTAQGTRSEARHFYLSVEGRPVPDAFRVLVLSGKSWVFAQRAEVWGDDGWLLEDKTRPVPETPTPLTASETERGWYKGGERKKGTPADWAFVAWEGGSAFVDARKLPEFAAAERLPLLPRQTGGPGASGPRDLRDLEAIDSTNR